MNLLCLLSEDVKKYTMSSFSKPCHSNLGAMPPTPISSSGHGTQKAGLSSGAGHRSAPATPLAKTTPTSERPSGAGLCTLPATLLRRTARRAEKDSGAGHGARPVTSGRHGQTVQSKNTLVRYHALLVLISCKMSLWGSLKQKCAPTNWLFLQTCPVVSVSQH